MNGFAFKAKNAARIGVPIIPLFLLSFFAVSLLQSRMDRSNPGRRLGARGIRFGTHLVQSI